MALRPTLKLIVGALAALLVAGTAVVLAAGSPFGLSRAHAKPAGPKVLRVACAHDGGGKLQYLAPGTKKCGGDVVHFPDDAPVVACQLDKPNDLKFKGKLAPPAHKHNVPGMLFVVSSGAKCKPPQYPDSHAVTLPRPAADLKLCAGKRRGTVRVVTKFTACNDREFRVVLAHFKPPQPNRAPDANDDTGLTDKEHAVSVPVLANDTDPDGDALHVAGVDTTGTKGSVSVNPNGTIKYDPNGAFDSLGPNDSAHDTFEYRASDGHASSGAATVDVTVTGVNHAPVLSGIESSALAYDTGTAGKPVSDTIAVSDPDGGNLAGATVAIGAGHVDPNDTLSASPPSGISANYDSSTGVLTLTGSAPVSDYETALRGVKFATTDPTPSGSRTVGFQVDDGNPLHHASNVVSRQVDVTNQPDPPGDLGLSPSSVAENLPAGATVGTLSTTDPDPGDSFTYSLATGSGDGDNGSFTISGATLKTSASFDFETKSSYSIRVRTTDSQSNTFEKQLTVTVDDANDAPTALSLSDSSVDENQPSGTAVGTLSSTDQDSGDSHTYSLVTGTGSTDNGSFTIDASGTLKTGASFDFETKSSYSIRVKTADGHGGSFEKQLTISVNDVNDAPTDLSLSNASVDENQPSGTDVGTLSSTDQDAGDSHTYSFATGTGDDDNSAFQISGDKLQTNATFDREAKSSYTIRVQTDDGTAKFEKQLTITVGDVNEPPTDISLSSTSVDENQPAGTTVGGFSATDPDLPGDSFTYTLVAGTGDTDNGSFDVSGNSLVTKDVFDKETKDSYSIRVKVDDGKGGTFEKQFTITVADADDAPTDLSLDNASVDENQASGTTVGTLSSTDQDSGDSHTYSLVTGTGDTDNGSFKISGDALQTNAIFDFETKSSYSIRIKTDDGNGGSFQKQVTITVTDVNDAPTDISLSNASVDENQPSGADVGTLSTTDQDAGDSHVYSFATGTGDDDNAKFQISGGDKLQTNAVFDFETKSSYSIRVKTDDGTATFEKQLTISVNDVNEPPTDISLDSSTVDENQPTGTTVGTFSNNDPDAGTSPTYTLVTGTGDTDNGSFQISGNDLLTNAVFDFETKNSYSIRVKVDDGHGGTFEEQFAISVADVNDAPTDITLSSSTVPANQADYTVGTLSTTDQDAGDTFTYAFAAGTGDDDNGSFTISGSTLKTGPGLAVGTYKVRIETDDGNGGTFDKAFTIDVVPNQNPSDIQLSNTSVDENAGQGTDVGTLSTVDPDAGDTHTYSLVTGTGDTDNADFQINGSTLEVSHALDFEAGGTRSIRIKTDDGHGGTFQKQFTITINNKNDPPTDIATTSTSVAENQPSGTTVGTLSSTDQDGADTHTYSLVTGTGDTDNGKFQISGSTLQTGAIFDFETKSSYSIRIKTDDGNGGTFEKQFTITVTDANDAPTDLALSPSTVPENSPIGTTVGNLSSTDQDAGDSHTYTLVSGTGSDDNASFTINGTAVQTNTLLDFETKSSYTIRVKTDDGHGGLFEKALTIAVSDQNDAPTNIALSKSDVDENLPSGTTVGSFSSTDQDSGDSHAYSLVGGTGSTDNGSFTIDASGNLKTAAMFNFESKSSYAIRVKTDDGHGGMFEKQFTIAVNNKNDPPTDIGLSKSDIDENQPSGTTIGAFSTTDEDVGDTFTYTLVGGTGSTDNASFTIDASGHLKSAASFNFESKSSYSIRVRTTDSGGAFTEKQFTISVNDVNDPPTTVQDDYSGAIGNTKAQVGTSSSGPVVTLSGSIPIANDSDEDQTFPHTVSAVPETVSSTGGGSATISADGSFTYLPGVGDKNLANDSFTYHATDGSLSSPGTVTIDIANQLVWYVDSSASSGGDGRSSSPFQTLASLNGAGGSGDSDGSGDYLFLYGSGNYAGGLPLEASQKLFGQPNGLTVDNGFGNQTLVSATGGPASSNPTIQNAGGDAIQLANGSDVERVNAGTASGVGVKGTGVTTSTVGSTTTISGASGGALALSGAAGGDIGIGSAITNGSNKSVSIANRSSGTVSLTGDVTDTGGGVSLSSNSGTVAFSGKVNLSTGSNDAFAASSGGTVTATGSGSTLSTTSGTALNLATTTIGASGLNFQSISAGTASGSAGNGIFLSNTGSSGSLTVTGTGGTCTAADTSGCTGGTIQHKTGSNTLSATPSGTGIVLNNTKSPSFTRMHLHDFGNYGIHGSDVNGFTLANSVTDGTNGDTSSDLSVTPSVFYNDSSILFDNPTAGGAALTGSASITNSAINGGYSNQVWVSNESGTLNRLTLSDDTFGDNNNPNGNDGVSLEGLGSATLNVTVQRDAFTGAMGDMFQMVDNSSSNGDLDFIDNSVIEGRPANQIATGGGGVTLSGGAGSGTFDIDMHNSASTNKFQGAVTNAVTIVKSAGSGSLHAVLDGIHVGLAGTANSGATEGSGVEFNSGGDAGTSAPSNTATLVLKNSDIRQYNNYGVDLQAGRGNAAAGHFNTTIFNNTFANPGNNSNVGNIFQGIHVNSGVNSSDSFQTCADIKQNTATNSGRNGGNDIRVRARQLTTVHLPGYTGSTTDTAAVAAYLLGRNTASTASASAPDAGSGGYQNTSPAGSDCPQ